MSDLLLRGAGLSVAYGGVRAVNEVDLEVRAGRVLGLIGPNGAGKTSLIDGISGFTPMTGNLELEGASLGHAPAYRRRHRGLSRTWQSVALFEDLTLLENVTVATGGGAAAKRRGLRSRQDEGLEKLRMVGLDHLADRLPGHVSHGQRVLVGVARALVDSPRVLLMDEPGAGLDDAERDALTALVRELAAAGVGVVMIDHDMNLIMSICDELHVLDFGRTVATGSPKAVAADPAVIAAYIGTAPAPEDQPTETQPETGAAS